MNDINMKDDDEWPKKRKGEITKKRQEEEEEEERKKERKTREKGSIRNELIKGEEYYLAVNRGEKKKQKKATHEKFLR